MILPTRPYTDRMVRVRGIAFIGAMQFVKDEFGPDAHQRVLDALPEDNRATFATPLRDAVWKPLDDLAAYAGTAKQLLAPQDDNFYVRLGFRAGRVEREEGGFHPMVVDAPTAIRLGAVIWRSLYDRGRMELIADGEGRALARIHDFPTSTALCQANCAALSGLLGSDEQPVQSEQVACVLDGAAWCEYRVTWTTKS
jgi:hypothetical protein